MFNILLSVGVNAEHLEDELHHRSEDIADIKEQVHFVSGPKQHVATWTLGTSRPRYSPYTAARKKKRKKKH